MINPGSMNTLIDRMTVRLDSVGNMIISVLTYFNI
jgi:hypothetical protein